MEGRAARTLPPLHPLHSELLANAFLPQSSKTHKTGAEQDSCRRVWNGGCSVVICKHKSFP